MQTNNEITTMAHKIKEKSPAVELAKARLAGMQQIDKNKGRDINYADDDAPITSATLDAEIKAVEANTATYNGLLKQADALGNQIETGESNLRDHCARVLSSAAGKFGRDSDEVQLVGGTRKSQRAKPVRKAASAPASTIK